MFKKSLQEDLQKIFDLKKTTFDKPSESQEQEACFIDVESSVCRVKDKRATARVTGKLIVFANSDKMPYGYFQKQIDDADVSLTKKFFFYQMEENRGSFMNIVERRVSFLYLFDSQYDPDLGTLNQITLTLTEIE